MYGKIFDSMYDGTLADDWRALITFQQFIVLCDADGFVDMTPSAISRRTGVPIEHIKAGIEILENTDPYSRTNNEDGRRIALIDDHRPWGWYIVNHNKYKHMADADTVREQNRIRKKQQREKQQGVESVTECHAPSQDVTECHAPSQNVTECHAPSQNVTECHAPSRYTDTDTDTLNTTSENSDKPPDKKKSKSKYNYSDEDMRFANWFLKKILDDLPDFKQPNLKSWANTVRLMRERDSRQLRDMGELFVWVSKNTFWKSNIQCLDKFRKQYDQLRAKQKNEGRGNENSGGVNRSGAALIAEGCKDAFSGVSFIES